MFVHMNKFHAGLHSKKLLEWQKTEKIANSTEKFYNVKKKFVLDCKGLWSFAMFLFSL